MRALACQCIFGVASRKVTPVLLRGGAQPITQLLGSGRYDHGDRLHVQPSHPFENTQCPVVQGKGYYVSHLPNGPRFMPWVSGRYLHDACGFYDFCARKYGDPFLLRTPFGPLVATGRPEGVRAIYTADPDTFDIFARSSVLPFLGPSSLMLAIGEPHLRARRLLMPEFHGSRISGFSASIHAIASECFDQWPVGVPFVAQELTHEMALQIILKLFFGAGDNRKHALRSALSAAHATISPWITFLSLLRHEFGGIGPWARFRRAMRELERVVYKMIADARETRSDADFLGLLAAARHEDGSSLSDQEIRDHLVSLVAAGHETLASSLAWALYWLHRNQGAIERLHEELVSFHPDDGFSKLLTMPYLDAVCKETLRLSPILPEVSRLLRKQFDFLGFTLPPGVGVATIATLVHMREEIYPEPDMFRPERFLASKFSAFEYIPFGGGSHRCLGAAFAAQEMKIVLATLLMRGNFRLCSTESVRPSRRSVPFGPGKAVRIVLERRTKSALAGVPSP